MKSKCLKNFVFRIKLIWPLNLNNNLIYRNVLNHYSSDILTKHSKILALTANYIKSENF
jgi:hypothetical protein